MSFISYAQNYEDVILWRALKHIEHGFYVDVGAQDPVIESVTKSFYDRGWRGINIEPVDTNFQLFQKLRPEDTNLKLAVGNSTNFVDFYEVLGTGLSTINPAFANKHAQEHGYTVCSYKVQVQSLTNILEEFASSEIHFLKIDVEGSELLALEGLDLIKFRPWIIVVESTLPNTQEESHHVWESLITVAHYHYVYFDGLNRFYIANEHSELDSCFNSPPNFWDTFQTFKENNLALKFQQVELSLQQSEEQRQHLEVVLQQSEEQRQHLEVVLQQSEEQRQHLEVVLQQSEEQRQHLEVVLQQNEHRFQQALSLALQKTEDQQQHLELMLHKLINSRSMRVTLPLRLVAHHARGLKQLVKKSLSVPKLLVKNYSKKLLINFAYQLSGNPQLKFITLNLLRYSPALKHRVKLLTLTSSLSHSKDLEHTHISTLSPHATRIFYNLKKAIQESSKS